MQGRRGCNADSRCANLRYLPCNFELTYDRQRDVIDLTFEDLEGKLAPSNRALKPVWDEDTDKKFTGGSEAQVKDEDVKAPIKHEPKGNNGEGPDQVMLARWRQGDDNMEASTKMRAMIKMLREWDASGDKCICYSQCASFPLCKPTRAELMLPQGHRC